MVSEQPGGQCGHLSCLGSWFEPDKGILPVTELCLFSLELRKTKRLDLVLSYHPLVKGISTRREFQGFVGKGKQYHRLTNWICWNIICTLFRMHLLSQTIWKVGWGGGWITFWHMVKGVHGAQKVENHCASVLAG